MRYFFTGLLFIFFSCRNDKVIQLPEINHSDITEINDVSAAYLFYDETQKDSLELNRKNLISTTNWLVNIDKRLTLKQVIPCIKFLQEKKQNSGHKNKNSKNYFTCNDISKNNLGFIEFTDVIFHEEPAGMYFSENPNFLDKLRLSIVFNSIDKIEIMGFIDNYINTTSNKTDLINQLKNLTPKDRVVEFIMNFDKNLTFQDYISIKSIISELDIENIGISNHEFIY